MKIFKLFSIALAALVLSINVNAQKADSKVLSFKVSGNCDQCKERIEGALKVDGVSKANWDEATQKVTVTYNPAKVKLDDLQKKVATAGHDTEKFKAEKSVYSKLPKCCQYDRKL
jgi:periplasmic mercuric ion binding protein